MSTARRCKQLEFHALSRRSVVGRFDGGQISSEGGALLLREVEKRNGIGNVDFLLFVSARA
jgi:hypothetical protein